MWGLAHPPGGVRGRSLRGWGGLSRGGGGGIPIIVRPVAGLPPEMGKPGQGLEELRPPHPLPCAVGAGQALGCAAGAARDHQVTRVRLRQGPG